MHTIITTRYFVHIICLNLIMALDCLWSQTLCSKSDPRYETYRNLFYSVFNHFRVCWIQSRVVPSSTINAKARILRFKIGLENRSKISQQQMVSARYEPIQGLCMPALYDMGRAKIIFQCFLPFSSMLNLMPSGTKLNYLYKGSNFTC